MVFGGYFLDELEYGPGSYINGGTVVTVPLISAMRAFEAASMLFAHRFAPAKRPWMHPSYPRKQQPCSHFCVRHKNVLVIGA